MIGTLGLIDFRPIDCREGAIAEEDARRRSPAGRRTYQYHQQFDKARFAESCDYSTEKQPSAEVSTHGLTAIVCQDGSLAGAQICGDHACSEVGQAQAGVQTSSRERGGCACGIAHEESVRANDTA